MRGSGAETPGQNSVSDHGILSLRIAGFATAPLFWGVYGKKEAASGGPEAAELVAGAGLEPTTFGL